MAKRRARKSKMKAGSCKRVKGAWLCKSKSGKVRFSSSRRKRAK